MPRIPARALLFLFATFCNTSLRAESGTLVHDSIIDPLAHNFPNLTFSVPTVHGVTFQQDGVVTYKGWQYAAYYQGNTSDASGKVSVGRRQLPYGFWQTLVLTDYNFTHVDSHNDVVIGICAGNGTIHLSFDHHVHPLRYRVSVPGLADNPTATAWNPSQFGPIADRLIATGTAMTSVTYPRFIPTPSGKLLFTYRFGGSGGGDEMLYEYDGATGVWSRVGQYTSRSGSYTGTFGTSSDRNGYFDNTIFDANGRLHATWCWRETPDASSNHDLLYAYSDDVGRTWKNQLGATIAVAGSTHISVNSPGIVAWTIPQRRNYINNSAMTVDHEGRVHVVAWHLPTSFPDQTTFSGSVTSNSRFIHYWRGIDGIWRKNETNLTGSRAKLSADTDGRLFLIYGNATNIQIAAATPSSHPETIPASSWNNWSPLTLSGALPAGKASNVNIINDTSRWETDRIISVYGQETNISGNGPTPLHVLDYHVSRAAVLPTPADGSTGPGVATELSWTGGQVAVAHDVYFGTSAGSVASATMASSEYLGRQAASTRSIGLLSEYSTYHWRVDSVAGNGTISPGRVWVFTTGSLDPSIANGTATRMYGGRATFSAVFEPIDPSLSSGDLTLFYGGVDGGSDPAAWENSISLGSRSAGTASVVADAVRAGLVYFRFQASTIHGTSWAATSAVLAPSDDLARWTHTAEIEINYGGTEALADFPVLLRLSPSNLPGFAYDQMLSLPHGDLRFSTPSGEPLSYQVEKWNTAGTSIVWVKVPQLAPGCHIRAWWGMAGQSAPPSAPTWSAYHGVWHLEEGSGFAMDSSINNLSGVATAVAGAADAVISGAGAFNGSTSSIAINNTSALNPSLISVEAWVKSSTPNLTSIFSKDQTNGGTNRVWQFRLNAGKPEFIVFNAVSNGTAASAVAILDNQFHHLCGTWDGSNVRLYVDGTLMGTTPCAGTLRGGQTNKAFIGRSENSSPAYFTGSIDEVRLSPVARSANWIRAVWDNQKPAASFTTARMSEVPDLDGDLLPDAWEIANFESTFTTNPDPDSDGLVNLLEFALGGDPNSGSNQPPVVYLPATSSAPGEFIYPQIAGGSGGIGTTYSAAGLRYTVEVSADLTQWHSGPDFVVWSNRREIIPGGMERVGIRVVDPVLSASPNLHARLRITAGN